MRWGVENIYPWAIACSPKQEVRDHGEMRAFVSVAPHYHPTCRYHIISFPPVVLKTQESSIK
jgi:hypothetical protein